MLSRLFGPVVIIMGTMPIWLPILVGTGVITMTPHEETYAEKSDRICRSIQGVTSMGEREWEKMYEEYCTP